MHESGLGLSSNSIVTMADSKKLGEKEYVVALSSSMPAHMCTTHDLICEWLTKYLAVKPVMAKSGN